MSSLLRRRFLSQNRIAFLIFAFILSFFMLFEVGYNSIRWDELVHCTGAWQLLQGQFIEYMSISSFYPPMFNLATAAFFGVAGPTVLSARLAAVTFSLLTIWLLFELTQKMYGPKIGLLSAVFLGIMPGVMWVSRLGYIETMLEFFFLASLFFFLKWLQTNNRKNLALSGVILGLGFLVKYQILAVGAVMAAILLISGRKYIKSRIKQFSILIVIVAAIALSWFAINYALSPDTINRWSYAISNGDQCRSLYSIRFPIPIYYLIEMVMPYPEVHPISPFLYLLGLSGLSLLLWRRKPQDKFMLAWFAAVYIVFTLVGNRQWRYIMPLYPVLAVSAAVAICFAYDKLKLLWQTTSKKRVNGLTKLAAGFLIVFASTAVFASCYDAYHFVSTDQVNIPIQEAVTYVAQRIHPNESIMLVCPFDFFSGGMVNFYLQINNKNNLVQGYPELPVDAYTPTFNVDVLLTRCQDSNVTYVLLSEHKWTRTFFNTTLSPEKVSKMLHDSGRFLTETTIGAAPDRIFILKFN